MAVVRWSGRALRLHGMRYPILMSATDCIQKSARSLVEDAPTARCCGLQHTRKCQCVTSAFPEEHVQLCKTRVGGWGTGRQHAQITGHTWQPGYYCEYCEATFSSHKLCKSHRKTCPSGVALPLVVAADDTPAPTVSHERRTSIAAIVSCRTCGEHFRDEETLEKHVKEHDAASPSVPAQDTCTLFQCTICKIEFMSELALSQHTASVSACRRCNVCIPDATMSLQDHYRVSTKHPMPCPWCDLGFDDFDELAPHYALCMPDNVKSDLGPAVRDAEVQTADAGPSSLSDTTTSSVAPERLGVGPESVVKYVVSTLCGAFSDVGGAPLTTGLGDPAVEEEPDAPAPAIELDYGDTTPAAPEVPSTMTDPEPAVIVQDNILRPTVAVPRLDDDAVEYDGFTDDADRSSVIAKAALDLISQRYGGTAAERVLRAMQELGGAIAEEQNARDETESLQQAVDVQQEVTTPVRAGPTDSCGSPSSAVRRFVETQREALAAERPTRAPRRHDLEPREERPQASTSAQATKPPARQKPNHAAKRPAVGTQSWHCRSCAGDPCVRPVATICGHIFCQDCLMRELREHGACPVCQKVFLIRLDVAEG
ncbi:hypothetical protein VTO73DRAFT_2842 [Trametes versicolor]